MRRLQVTGRVVAVTDVVIEQWNGYAKATLEEKIWEDGKQLEVKWAVYVVRQSMEQWQKYGDRKLLVCVESREFSIEPYPLETKSGLWAGMIVAPYVWVP